jgi:hypothetical protein
MGVKIIRRVVNKVHARKMETKTSTSSVSDGIEIFHNNFVVLDPTSNFLRTTGGVSDAMTGDGQCVGDENNLKGISIKMMVELNERYSDVTHHLILLCSSKGDTPSLERFLDPGPRALTSTFFVGPTLASFSFPDHLMSGQAQATQVEGQTAQVQQEYYREEKHEHKTLDTKLLAPKSWAFWMVVVNHNSHRLTDHDKCVVESLNHIIRHQNVVVALFEQLLDHHQDTDTDEDTQTVMVSLQYIVSANDSSKSALDDFGQKWKITAAQIEVNRKFVHTHNRDHANMSAGPDIYDNYKRQVNAYGETRVYKRVSGQLVPKPAGAPKTDWREGTGLGNGGYHPPTTVPSLQLPQFNERLRSLKCSVFSTKKEHRSCLTISKVPELSNYVSPSVSCFQEFFVAREHQVCSPQVPRKGNDGSILSPMGRSWSQSGDPEGSSLCAETFGAKICRPSGRRVCDQRTSQGQTHRNIPGPCSGRRTVPLQIKGSHSSGQGQSTHRACPLQHQ